MFRKKQPKAKTILYQENMNKEKLKETFVVFDLFFHRMIRICLLSVYPNSKNLFPRVGVFRMMSRKFVPTFIGIFP